MVMVGSISRDNMDLLRNLDRVILRAEVREEGLLDSINYLFEGLEDQQINKANSWINDTKQEIALLSQITENLEDLIQNIGDDKRVLVLESKCQQAIRQVEQKRYLIEMVQGKLGSLLKSKVVQNRNILNIPNRRVKSVKDSVDIRLEDVSEDLGQGLLDRLRTI